MKLYCTLILAYLITFFNSAAASKLDLPKTTGISNLSRVAAPSARPIRSIPQVSASPAIDASIKTDPFQMAGAPFSAGFVRAVFSNADFIDTASAQSVPRPGFFYEAPPARPSRDAFVPTPRVLVADPNLPGSGTFTFNNALRTIELYNIENITDFISHLPDSFRKNYALLYRSQSSQVATPALPRAILFGEDATLIFAFNGTGNTVESIEQNQAGHFVFREIEFNPNQTTNRVVVRSGPTLTSRCATCHGDIPHPIWDRYNNWPGAFGENDGTIGDDPNIPPYDPYYSLKHFSWDEVIRYGQFLDQFSNTPSTSINWRYRAGLLLKRGRWTENGIDGLRRNGIIPGYDGSRSSEFEPGPYSWIYPIPNIMLGVLLTKRTTESLLARMRSSPNYSHIRYYLLWRWLCSNELNEFLPQSRLYAGVNPDFLSRLTRLSIPNAGAFSVNGGYLSTQDSYSWWRYAAFKVVGVDLFKDVLIQKRVQDLPINPQPPEQSGGDDDTDYFDGVSFRLTDWLSFEILREIYMVDATFRTSMQPFDPFSFSILQEEYGATQAAQNFFKSTLTYDHQSNICSYLTRRI